MYNMKVCCVFFCLLSLISCSDNSENSTKIHSQDSKKDNLSSQLDKVTEDKVSQISSDLTIEKTKKPAKTEQEKKTTVLNYERLQKKIIYGNASFADVRRALTDTNTSELTNTIHALYSMRGHRGVYNLLFDMWKLNKDKFRELAWEQISKPPARIALASTINRIQIINTDEYKNYIRSFKNDKHEFHLAQVVVALGFNGDPDDIEYIKAMANGENHYVAQSAITALAIMGGNQARDAMIELLDIHKDTPRGDLIKTLLKKAYDWPPSSKDIFNLEKAINNQMTN